MRIIGGHDYYDAGLAYGQDDSVVFLRNEARRLDDDAMRNSIGIGLGRPSCRLVRGPDDREDRSRRRFVSNDEIGVEFARGGRTIRHEASRVFVVLCGVMHRGLRMSATSPYGTHRLIDDRWVWTKEGFDAYLTHHGIGVMDFHTSRTDPAIGIDAWFEPTKLPDRTVNRLVDERIVVASRTPGDHERRLDGVVDTWRINQPTLRDIGFAKAVDPYTAFQEISMWIGGVLPKDGPKAVEIVDDVIRLQKHGFDHPTSFRKAGSDSRR